MEEKRQKTITLEEIIKKLTEENVLKSFAVGATASMPLQYEYFELLKLKATKEELKTLLDHENGVIKCYAFWALVQISVGFAGAFDSLSPSELEQIKKTTLPEELFDILVENLDQTEEITSQFGCVIQEESLSKIMVHYIASYFLSNDQKDKLEALGFDLSYLDRDALGRISNTREFMRYLTHNY